MLDRLDCMFWVGFGTFVLRVRKATGCSKLSGLFSEDKDLRAMQVLECLCVLLLTPSERTKKIEFSLLLISKSKNVFLVHIIFMFFFIGWLNPTNTQITLHNFHVLHENIQKLL